jgi:hypothetical protein
MSKADKKQRHRAKREAKKLAMRRREAAGPLKRLAGAPGDIECWMSDSFELNGQMQLFAYKRAAGLSGMACFLVDEGVVGLKDAWTRIGVERVEFNEMIDGSRERGIPMRRATVDEVRRWIASGIRWANENGMRLPKDWVKTVSLIGGVGDWASADVSAFVKEFAGHPNDLRQRLIREPFDTYIQRSDINFVFSNAATYLDQDSGEYIEEDNNLDDLDEDELQAIADDLPVEEVNALAERLAPTAVGLVEETSRWLATRGNTPSTELVEAWRSILLAAMMSGAAMPDAPQKDVADFGFELLEGMSDRIDEIRRIEYQHAVEQALEHLQTDSSMMQKAVLKYGMAEGLGDGFK